MERRVEHVTVSPPASLAELRTRYEEVGNDPALVAGLFVMAMLEFTRDPVVGAELIGFLMTGEHLVGGSRGKEKVLCRSVLYHLERLEHRPHLARSYIQGATPGNSYSLPPPPYTVAVERGRNPGPGRVRLFLHCSGAQSPRSVLLQQTETGGWKLREESSLYAGIIPPAA